MDPKPPKFKPFPDSNRPGFLLAGLLLDAFGQKRLEGTFNKVKEFFQFKLKNSDLDPMLVSLVRVIEELTWVKSQVERIAGLEFEMAGVRAATERIAALESDLKACSEKIAGQGDHLAAIDREIGGLVKQTQALYERLEAMEKTAKPAPTPKAKPAPKAVEVAEMNLDAPTEAPAE